MTTPQRPSASRSKRLGLFLAALSVAVTGYVFWLQIEHERRQGVDDLTRRAELLAHRILPAAREALAGPGPEAARALGDRLDGHMGLLGLALYDSAGQMLAGGPGMVEWEAALEAPVREALRSSVNEASVRRDGSGSMHVLVRPVLGDGGRPMGAIVVAHDAGYLEDRTTRGVLRGATWAAAIGVGMYALATGLVWALFERPLVRLAEWMRRLRFGNTPELPPRGLPVVRLTDESTHLAASLRAVRTKEHEQAQEAVRSDKAWTRERLRAHAIDALGGRALVVVSNREPYVHQLKDGKPTLVHPASGLVTGLDPILRACGGLWVAHGAGDADRQTVDTGSCIAVPPDDPRYTLRRVWITREEEQGYYYGFSNEGLWPLCHLTHERPVFRAQDWEQYVKANQRFADAVLEEVGTAPAVVVVQDYHLALVPGMLKAANPELRVGLFWHIPWPNAEVFRICPYRVELLHGMLGADVLGFHLRQHCNNFLDAVDRMVEARLDRDRSVAELKGHVAAVRPFPISVQPWSERGVPVGNALRAQVEGYRARYGLGDMRIGVGVDRIDYTKGIAERFRALERLYEKHPEHRGRFTFVQLGAPSRTHIPRYRDLVTELETLADRINWKFQTDGWKPIVLLVDQHEGPIVHAFLSMASVCVVSSLHDGMNLVAKEFVAANAEAGEQGEGVLVLSEFAGAARDLPEALIINPYDTEEFADAIHRALDMDPAERRQRMRGLAQRVEEFNIYRWAAELLSAITATKDGEIAAIVASAAGGGTPGVKA